MNMTAAPTATPTETVTPIKASEAIRLGCLIAPVQGFGSLYGSNSRSSGIACAVGAALLGGFTHETSIWRPIHELDCPEGCARYDAGTPAHLNDDHRWSRERIADWLEGLGL